jgi:hypothetical protein
MAEESSFPCSKFQQVLEDHGINLSGAVGVVPVIKILYQALWKNGGTDLTIVKEASNLLLQNFEAYPIPMALLGVGVSLYLLSA